MQGQWWRDSVWLHHYYKCGNKIYKKSCDKRTVKKDWIERLVAAYTRNDVLCDEVIDRLADAVVETSAVWRDKPLFIHSGYLYRIAAGIVFLAAACRIQVDL